MCIMLCASCSLSTMHFQKMPPYPQDALCSLNNKMHGIGSDGLGRHGNDNLCLPEEAVMIKEKVESYPGGH